MSLYEEHFYLKMCWDNSCWLMIYNASAFGLNGVFKFVSNRWPYNIIFSVKQRGEPQKDIEYPRVEQQPPPLSASDRMISLYIAIGLGILVGVMIALVLSRMQYDRFVEERRVLRERENRENFVHFSELESDDELF